MTPKRRAAVTEVTEAEESASVSVRAMVDMARMVTVGTDAGLVSALIVRCIDERRFGTTPAISIFIPVALFLMATTSMSYQVTTAYTAAGTGTTTN